jgi:hypothetical protein
MANVKISQLPVTTSPQGAGLIPIVQDGTTYSTTVNELVGDNGVSSFNTRKGAVTLQSTDVTGALGYTPVNPTTLADYVPESRTITINGTTQDLSTNRTWTIGGNTIQLQSDGAITAGDAVVINDAGDVSTVVATSISPSANAEFAGNTGVYASTASYSNAKRVVSPHNPNMSIFVYDDPSMGYLYAALEVGIEGTGTPVEVVPVSPLIITSILTSYDVQWDPFNPNLVLVAYTDGSNLNFQYIYVNNVWNVANNVTPIALYNASIYTIANVATVAFQFSEQYQNLITILYTDTTLSNCPQVVNASIRFDSASSTTMSLGISVSLSTTIPFYGTNNVILNRLEGKDKFIFGFPGYDSSSATPYQNNVWIWTLGSTPFDGYYPPTPNVGAAYNVLDNSAPPYDSYVYAGKVSFIDDSRFVYGAWRYLGMARVLITVVGTYSGVTINSVGTPVETADVSPNNISSLPAFVQMPNNKNYILWYYLYYDGGSSTYSFQGRMIKVTSGTTLSTYSSQLMLLPYSTAPLFRIVDSNQYPWLAVITNDVNGIATLFFTTWNGSSYYHKKSTITYVNQVFNSQNLLGIAQNTVADAETVDVIPFGGVDENQTGLTAGTYYLQSDGTLTQNVTPFILGRTVNATTIKTANYPTI